MATERLSPLDMSFLEVETPSAHMHVAFKGRFEPLSSRPEITLERVRAQVASRLGAAPRFRQRLAFGAGGIGAPAWVDDGEFDLGRHVVALSSDSEELPRDLFDRLVDDVLSRPLDRSHALWEIHVAPRLSDGTVGIAMKAHHAMVDGLSAVSLTMLLLDLDPLAPEPAPLAASEWAPRAAPSPARLALDSFADAGMQPLRALGSAARLAASGGGRSRIVDSVRAAALAVGEDVLRPAPSSRFNVPIGGRRTLVGHSVALDGMLAIKRERRVTLNDTAVAVVAGALRQLSLGRGQMPRPLKVMVPVARRSAAQAAGLGNKISFVTIELPVHLRSPIARLDAVHSATTAFKAGSRADGGELLLDALGYLPGPLQSRAARLAASPRAYNLVISNVPGPRQPVYLLGARALEAFPVIPLSEGHALSIGIFTLDDRLCFGGYADPDAMPDARELPGALAAATLELAAGGRRAARRSAA